MLGARRSRSVFFGLWGDISTGRILPPHGRDRGSSPRRSTRTSRSSWVTCLLSKTHPTRTLCSSADFNAGAVGLRIASSPGDAMPGEVGRPVSGAVAHLGERLTGSQEVVGSIPTGSTISSLVLVLVLVLARSSAAQAQEAGPLFGKQETASAILASSSLVHAERERPAVKMAGSHPADAGSTPAVRSRFHLR
jgi:hypothetical protein